MPSLKRSKKAANKYGSSSPDYFKNVNERKLLKLLYVSMENREINATYHFSLV